MTLPGNPDDEKCRLGARTAKRRPKAALLAWFFVCPARCKCGGGRRLPRVLRAPAAAFRAVLDLVPVAFPLLAPVERQLAMCADLRWQFGFFAHFHTDARVDDQQKRHP